MMHPSSLDLEAFACGETDDAIEAHLRACAECSAFVERVRGALSAGPSRSRAADFVAKTAARLDEEPPNERAPIAPARRTWLVTASTVAVPLAAAAALLALVRTPSTRDALVPSQPSTTAAASSTEPEPETTFKGSLHVAVIRERAGEQTRFTERVDVKPGDRLRVEVALDRTQAILAAIVGDDASWLELMSGDVLQPGTHFSDRAARVDASPTNGLLLVGSPEAVAHARASGRFDEVAVIHIEWEAP